MSRDNNLIPLMCALIFVLLVFSIYVSSAWTPRDDIDLKDNFSLLGGVYLNATTLYENSVSLASKYLALAGGSLTGTLISDSDIITTGNVSAGNVNAITAFHAPSAYITTVYEAGTSLASKYLALAGGTMSGDLAMGSNSITGAANVNATTFYEGGSLLSAIYCTLTGCTMAGDVAMGSNSITGATYVNATNLSGNITWNSIYNYPVACPNGAITTLGDTVTCTDSWVDVTGDSMTGSLTSDSDIITTGNVSAANVNASTAFHAPSAYITTVYEAGTSLANTYLGLAGGTMTGNLVMGDNHIVTTGNLSGGNINSSGWNFTSAILGSNGRVYSTIQAGVDGVAGDGWVYVPAGTYDGIVTLNSNDNNLTLYGAGQATILNGIGGSGVRGAITIYGASNVTIRDLAVRTTPGEGQNFAGILVTGSPNVGHISNNVLIERVCVLESDYMGILLWQPKANFHDFTITHCSVSNVDECGIYVTGTNSSAVFERVIVTDNIITDGGQGISIHAHTARGIVSNNQIYNTSSYGVHIRSHDSIVSNNIIDTTGDDGIFIELSSNITIIGNRIKDWTNEAIDNDGTDSRIYQPTYKTDLPGSCSTNIEGAQYSDASLHMSCYCNGMNWVQMDDFSTQC